jgi:hypothetical protein
MPALLTKLLPTRALLLLARTMFHPCVCSPLLCTLALARLMGTACT